MISASGVVRFSVIFQDIHKNGQKAGIIEPPSRASALGGSADLKQLACQVRQEIVESA
ncbi:hypothetical protein LC593_11310 [Nostoc sp. CHAB 5844]|nr:hypothetical protein [Nostoc sp. CHAB 5844]